MHGKQNIKKNVSCHVPANVYQKVCGVFIRSAGKEMCQFYGTGRISCSLLGVKRPKRDVDHSPVSSA